MMRKRRYEQDEQSKVTYSNHYSAGLIPYIKIDNEYKVLLIKKTVICQQQIYAYLDNAMKESTQYEGLELLKRKFYNHAGGMLFSAGGRKERGEYERPFLTATREFIQEVVALFSDDKSLDKKIEKHISLFLNENDILYALPGKAEYADDEGKADAKKRACYPFYGLDIAAFLKYVEDNDKKYYPKIQDTFDKMLDSEWIAKKNEMIQEVDSELFKTLQKKLNNEPYNKNLKNLKTYEVYVHPWVNLTEALTLLKDNINKTEAIKNENERWVEYLFPIYQELYPHKLDALDIKNKDDLNTKMSKHLVDGGTDFLVKAIEELQYYIETGQNEQNNAERAEELKKREAEQSSLQSNSNQQFYNRPKINQTSQRMSLFDRMNSVKPSTSTNTTKNEQGDTQKRHNFRW